MPSVNARTYATPVGKRASRTQTPAMHHASQIYTPTMQHSPLSQRPSPTFSPLNRMTRSYLDSLPTLHPIRHAPVNVSAEARQRKKVRDREKKRAAKKAEKQDEALEEALKARIVGWSAMDSQDRNFWKVREQREPSE